MISCFLQEPLYHSSSFMASIVSCRSLLCFNISLFFFSSNLLPTCELLPLPLSLPPHNTSVRSPFLRLSFLAFPSFFFSLRSFYLTHTVIVKPRVQMLRSVPPPFSMQSCEKTREPRLECLGRFFFLPGPVSAHTTVSLWTQTLSKNTFFVLFFFFWPTFIWHVVPLMVLVELN